MLFKMSIYAYKIVHEKKFDSNVQNFKTGLSRSPAFISIRWSCLFLQETRPVLKKNGKFGKSGNQN